MPEITDDMRARAGFQKELESLINRYSEEAGSDTPDFILARYLCDCLEVWNACTRQREDWYGHRHEPARLSATDPQHLDGRDDA